MLFILDTADLEKIKHCCEFYPVAGVTTNPSIVAKEKTDFLKLMKDIRAIIGEEKMLHIQLIATDCDGMVKEAQMLTDAIGGNLYFKIPISEEGLKATTALKKLGMKVTETAIFTQQQALVAANAGADFVAPYVNRLDNIVADGVNVVNEIVELFELHDVDSNILAASFKNVEQVHQVALTGAQAVTINPELMEMLIYHPLTDAAVDGFNKDWQSVYGDKKIADLL